MGEYYGRGDYTQAELIDVLSGFDYGYRMRCECTATVWLSSHQYWQQSSGEPTLCEQCGGSTPFGPATALLRDDDDRALSNEMVGRLAWYHTSTYSDWPSSSFAVDATRFLDEHPMRDMVALETIAELSLSKALHVGTYEAAIENMLRRMQDQPQPGIPFYLHRVHLHLAAGEINDGYRDEDYDHVSHVGLAELEVENLFAIRYLNVRESGGSLSLAIDPAAIRSVQSIALPIPALAPQPNPEHLHTLRTLDRGEAEADSARAAEFADRFEQLMKEFDTVTPQAETRRPPKYRPSVAGLDFLQDTYLPGVGPAGRHAVGQGLAAWYDDDGDAADAAEGFYHQFLAHAALLTRPEAVVAAVRKQPVRAGEDIEVVCGHRAVRHRTP